MGKVIAAIHVQELSDDSPDTSWLGEYTNKQSDWAIYRREGRYVHDLESEVLREEYASYLADDAQHVDDDGEPCEPESYEDWRDNYTGDGYDFREGGKEYTYFLPYAGGEEPGSDDYRKYGLQNFDRMERFSRGDWHFCGIRVCAEIIVNGVYQKIQSGGIFGVESDCNQSDRQEIIQEQLEELKGQLSELGFSDNEIGTAIDDAEIDRHRLS